MGLTGFSNNSLQCVNTCMITILAFSYTRALCKALCNKSKTTILTNLSFPSQESAQQSSKWYTMFTVIKKNGSM